LGNQLEDEEIILAIKLDFWGGTIDQATEGIGAEDGAAVLILDADVENILFPALMSEETKDVGLTGASFSFGNARGFSANEATFGDFDVGRFGEEIAIGVGEVDIGADAKDSEFAEGVEVVEIDGAFEGSAGANGEGVEVVIGVPWRDDLVVIAGDLEAKPRIEGGIGESDVPASLVGDGDGREDGFVADVEAVFDANVDGNLGVDGGGEKVEGNEEKKPVEEFHGLAGFWWVTVRNP